MSPKKAKSRKERVAEAVKDLVDASNSSTFSVDSLLADRSRRGDFARFLSSALMSMVPNIFPTSGDVHTHEQQESSIYFKGAHIK